MDRPSTQGPIDRDILFAVLRAIAIVSASDSDAAIRIIKILLGERPAVADVDRLNWIIGVANHELASLRTPESVVLVGAFTSPDPDPST